MRIFPAKRRLSFLSFSSADHFWAQIWSTGITKNAKIHDDHISGQFWLINDSFTQPLSQKFLRSTVVHCCCRFPTRFSQINGGALSDSQRVFVCCILRCIKKSESELESVVPIQIEESPPSRAIGLQEISKRIEPLTCLFAWLSSLRVQLVRTGEFSQAWWWIRGGYLYPSSGVSTHLCLCRMIHTCKHANDARIHVAQTLINECVRITHSSVYFAAFAHALIIESHVYMYGLWVMGDLI